MMINRLRLKIYLFYGAIFFSLGLVGVILNKGTSYSLISQRFNILTEKLKIYSDFDWDLEPAIPVFNSTNSSHSLQLIYHQGSNKTLIEEMKTVILNSNIKLTLIPIWPTKSILQEIAKNIKLNQLLIGLELVKEHSDHENKDDVSEYYLYFTSQLSEDEQSLRFVQFANEVNDLKLSKIIIDKQTYFYKVSWCSNEVNAKFMIETITNLIINSQYIQPKVKQF